MGKGKKKDIQKRRGRIIRLRQRTITSYFPRYPGVINFARRRKTIDRSPEVSLDVIRGVNIDVCRSQVPAGFDHNHDPVEPVPESSKEKKKKERRKKGKKRVGGCYGLVPHPQLPPFFVSLFPRPLTFFHTLLATRLSLSPSFVIDYTSRSRCCCRLRRRKEEINDDTDKLI